MQGRLRWLRENFGLDQTAMAALLEVEPEQVAAWERAMTPEGVQRIAERFGLSPEWVAGAEATMWGARVQKAQRKVAQSLRRLSGTDLITILAATTGERVAHVVRILMQADPELFTLHQVSLWLGLSQESTELLLRDALDPGTPVIVRTSELAGVSEIWFRKGSA